MTVPRRTAGRRAAAVRSFAAALLALGPGCGRSPEAPLRVGINPWPGYELLMLAQEQGLFERCGANVRILEFGSQSDSRRAFERGQVDGIGATAVEFLLARHNCERNPQVVAVLDYSCGADVVLGRGDVETLEDLRGARVAIEPGSLNAFVLARALETIDAGLPDVELVLLDPADMEQAFERGEVDAAVSYPPVSVRLIERQRARRLFTSAQIPGEVVDVLMVDEQVIRERTDDVQALARGFQAAVEFARAQPGKTERALAAHLGVEPRELRRVLAEEIRLVTAEEQAQLIRPGGEVEQAFKKVDQVLRDTAQIDGPDRTQGLLAPHLVPGPSASP